MIQFTYSAQTSTLKFSAKSSTITLPKCVEGFPQEEQDIIKEYCLLARDIYIKKITEHSVSTVGKRLCAIQARNTSLKEATEAMLSESPNLPSILQKLNSSTTRKIKPKLYTYLDFIEANK